MAQSTQQTAIANTGTAQTVLTADSRRRYMMIRNYSDSGQILWVAFGVAATCGTAGELEILAGYNWEFGVTRLVSADGVQANNLTFQQPNVPLESVSVIAGARGAPASGANGCIMVISP
jgi:hypothetical protein